MIKVLTHQCFCSWNSTNFTQFYMQQLIRNIHNSRAVGNTAILNILTISFSRALRSQGLNEGVPSRYIKESMKRLENRKLVIERQKKKKKTAQPSHLLSFFLLKSMDILINSSRPRPSCQRPNETDPSRYKGVHEEETES